MWMLDGHMTNGIDRHKWHIAKYFVGRTMGFILQALTQIQLKIVQKIPIRDRSKNSNQIQVKEFQSDTCQMMESRLIQYDIIRLKK